MLYCRCGFSCGVPSALERHMARVGRGGDARNHGPSDGPPEVTRPSTAPSAAVPSSPAFSRIAEVKEKFRLYDKDGNGRLDFDEMSAFLRKSHPTMTDRQLRLLFRRVDENSDSSISIDEFVKFINDKEEYMDLDEKVGPSGGMRTDMSESSKATGNASKHASGSPQNAEAAISSKSDAMISSTVAGRDSGAASASQLFAEKLAARPASGAELSSSRPTSRFAKWLGGETKQTSSASQLLPQPKATEQLGKSSLSSQLSSGKLAPPKHLGADLKTSIRDLVAPERPVQPSTPGIRSKQMLHADQCSDKVAPSHTFGSESRFSRSSSAPLEKLSLPSPSSSKSKSMPSSDQSPEMSATPKHDPLPSTSGPLEKLSLPSAVAIKSKHTSSGDQSSEQALTLRSIRSDSKQSIRKMVSSEKIASTGAARSPSKQSLRSDHRSEKPKGMPNINDPGDMSATPSNDRNGSKQSMRKFSSSEKMSQGGVRSPSKQSLKKEQTCDLAQSPQGVGSDSRRPSRSLLSSPVMCAQPSQSPSYECGRIPSLVVKPLQIEESLSPVLTRKRSFTDDLESRSRASTATPVSGTTSRALSTPSSVASTPALRPLQAPGCVAASSAGRKQSGSRSSCSRFNSAADSVADAGNESDADSYGSVLSELSNLSEEYDGGVGFTLALPAEQLERLQALHGSRTPCPQIQPGTETRSHAAGRQRRAVMLQAPVPDKVVRLLVVRHAESANKRRPEGEAASRNPGLTELGHEQASKLGARLANDFRSRPALIQAGSLVIVASPMRRCLFTIQPAVKSLNIPCEYCLCHGGLYEFRCAGLDYAGTRPEEILEEFPFFHAVGFSDAGGWDYRGDSAKETEDECKARAERLVQWLHARANQMRHEFAGRGAGTILLSIHQTLADLLITLLIEGDADGWSYGSITYRLANTAMTEVFLHPNGQHKLGATNDNSHARHLKPLPRAAP